jgi:hypothetical protein
LFIPQRYRDIILSAYKILKIEIDEKTDSSVSTKGDIADQSFFDMYRDMTWNRALISARGSEVISQKLQAFTDVLLENGIVCILLSIDLEDPSAWSLVETAVNIGYFYSGVFPESFPGGHDAIQMQFLHNVKVDPSSIQIYQESGKEIYEFIRDEVKHIFPVPVE